MVLPGKALKSAQSYNSNRFLVYGLLRDMGLNVIDLGIVPDDYSKTLAMLSKAGEVADVIISSGGVSVGEEDHVKTQIKKLGELGFLGMMVDPKYGGVTASLAMLGDINIAEPKAFVGFAGRRVIEQTVRVELPEDFQKSEFLLEHGAIDMIVHRSEIRSKIIGILDKISK